MESNRPEKKSGKVDWVWLMISIGLYGLSTVGLAGGFGAGLAYGIEGTTRSAYTISAQTALILGWLVAIIIQLYETKVLVHWKQEDAFEKNVAKTMFVLDFFAICLAIGVHTNIIWMVQNHSDVAGMIVHGIGLPMQLFAAFLGSVVAEMAFAKAVGSFENLPQIGLDIVKLFHRRPRVRQPSKQSGSGQWQPLPPDMPVAGVLREIKEQPGMVLVRGNDGQRYVASGDDPRVTERQRPGQVHLFSTERVG